MGGCKASRVWWVMGEAGYERVSAGLGVEGGYGRLFGQILGTYAR